jgi:hypothetical protein
MLGLARLKVAEILALEQVFRRLRNEDFSSAARLLNDSVASVDGRTEVPVTGGDNLTRVERDCDPDPSIAWPCVLAGRQLQLGCCEGACRADR